MSLEGVSDATIQATRLDLSARRVDVAKVTRRAPVRPRVRESISSFRTGESIRASEVATGENAARPSRVHHERLPERASRAVTRERLTIELLLAEPGRAVPVLLATFAFFATALFF